MGGWLLALLTTDTASGDPHDVWQVYLVMDYQPGGELFSYLREEGTFTEDTVRFYLAEMILALEHLHSHGIIHRFVFGSRTSCLTEDA